MSRETRLLKNTAIIAIGNLCTKCVSFLLLPLYTTILSTAESGTVDIIGTYTGLVAIVATMQLEQGVFRYLVDSRSDPNKQSLYITNTLYMLCGGLAIVLAGTAVVLSVLQYQYIYYFLALVTLTSVNGVLLQIPRGLGNNIIYAAGSCLNGVIHIALNVLFIAGFRMGVSGMLLANAAAMLVSSAYIVLRLKLWRKLNLSVVQKSVMLEVLKYSAPLIGGALCWWIVGASDRVIISVTLGAAYNGIYAIANKFPSILSVFGNIFNVAWTESAAENAEDGQKEAYYEKTVGQAVTVYSSCNLVAICALALVFSFLVKGGYAAAYGQIPILMVGAVVHMVASWLGAIYVAFKKSGHVALTTGLAAVLNVLINILFVRRIGLYAASVSSLVAFAAMALVRYKGVQRYARIHINIKAAAVELGMYAGVLVCYYCGSTAVQLCALLVSVGYCFLKNKVILKKIIEACAAWVKKRVPVKK